MMQEKNLMTPQFLYINLPNLSIGFEQKIQRVTWEGS